MCPGQGPRSPTASPSLTGQCLFGLVVERSECNHGVHQERVGQKRGQSSCDLFLFRMHPVVTAPQICSGRAPFLPVDAVWWSCQSGARIACCQRVSPSVLGFSQPRPFLSALSPVFPIFYFVE